MSPRRPGLVVLGRVTTNCSCSGPAAGMRSTCSPGSRRTRAAAALAAARSCTRAGGGRAGRAAAEPRALAELGVLAALAGRRPGHREPRELSTAPCRRRAAAASARPAVAAEAGDAAGEQVVAGGRRRRRRAPPDDRQGQGSSTRSLFWSAACSPGGGGRGDQCGLEKERRLAIRLKRELPARPPRPRERSATRCSGSARS